MLYQSVSSICHDIADTFPVCDLFDQLMNRIAIPPLQGHPVQIIAIKDSLFVSIDQDRDQVACRYSINTKVVAQHICA